MPFKFYLDKDTDVQRMLELAPERVVLTMVNAIDDGVTLMAEQIRQNVSGGVLERRTGTLEESVQKEAPRITGLRVDEGIEAGGGWAYYGRMQELGVDHPWQEENLFVGKPMAFEAGGDELFKTIVEHPALEARPWFFPVLEENVPVIVDKVKTALDEELAK